MLFLCKNANMKVVVIAPSEILEEWRKLPLSTDPKTEVFYSGREGIQELPGQLHAVLYLFPEYDSSVINWLKQLPVPVCIVNAVIATTAELGEKLVRMNAWPGFLGTKVEMAASNSVNHTLVDEVIQGLGRETEWVTDSCGMIAARVVASIINEAYFAMEDEVSTAAEIDTAMKMGTNYPYGPVEWGKKIGLNRIYKLLEKLSAQQKRYTPSSLLKNEALA